jgi:hypothetical protein
MSMTALHLLLAEAPIFTVRDSPEALLPGRSDHFQPAGDEVAMASDGSHRNDSADAETAKTESLYREVNERMTEVNAQRASLDRPQEVICECAHPECSKLITMTAVEYRGLRLNGTWFVIAPHEEHFFPEVERIVAQDVHYWVVEKHGKAGEVAEKLDPRNRQA